MAEFLTRKGIVFHIDRIIKEAEEEIVLISPFINADDETKRLISQTTPDITIDVIYGKRELKQDEKEFFNKPSVKLTYRKDLHAKCYLNEEEAIITSMNLYEYSQLYNDEMGILVSRKNDRELYEAIYKQAMEWKEDGSGVDEPATGRRNTGGIGTLKEDAQIVEESVQGFCIRCQDNLSIDPTKPYCTRCYASWKRYKNERHKENYCHFCGSGHKTTLLKPLCLTCYRELEDVLDSLAD